MKKLYEYTESMNIAEGMGDDRLRPIAQMVIDNFSEDWDSMDEYRELVDKGMELAKPSITPRSQPWQGAANYKSTGILGAAIKFGDRASLEILRDKNLLKMEVVGENKDDEKQDKADRIKVYENYHINHKMDDFREDQEGLCYSVAGVGTMFKKVYFDPMENKKVSSIIHYPNFAVSQGTRKLQDAPSFTEIHDFSENQAHTFMEYGIWCKCDLGFDKRLDNQSGKNANEDADNAEENHNRFLEQYCFLDLDDDGYAEPYIVMVHEASGNVVRIVADYSLDGIIIKNGDAILTLKEAYDMGEEVYKEICKTASLVKIKREMNLVKYGFIRSIDGTYLDIGYFYLLAAMTMLVNTTTNQLVDSGTINNMGGGFLAKEFRRKGGMTRFKPGEFKQTDIPAANMNGGVLPLPIKEPSQTLLALNEMVKAEIKEFSNDIDLSGVMSANTPATTALVAVQEQIMPTSAIVNRLLRAQSKEFEMLYKLTPKYCKDAEYQEVTGSDATIEGDYDETTAINVTACKKMSTDVTRMFEGQIALSMLPQIQAAGGKGIPIIKGMIDLLDTIDSNEVFPEMTPEQLAQQEQMMQIEQMKQAQLLDLQIQKEMKAVEAFKAEQMGFQAKHQAEMAKIQGEMAKLQAEIDEMRTKSELNRANAMKSAAEAEETALENDAVKTGVRELINNLIELEEE
jgi:chaperonin GroES